MEWVDYLQTRANIKFNSAKIVELRIQMVQDSVQHAENHWNRKNLLKM